MKKPIGVNPLIIISGPTASGKSELALQLAEILGEAEILCADSITVYRGFEIGSAKPSPEERKKIPHHLLDLVDPTENFTAGDFIRSALPIIKMMHEKNKIPIIAGGTGFYLRALLKGMASEEEDNKKAELVRSELEKRAADIGWKSLYEELLNKDPEAQKTVHANDHYRILRALQAMQMNNSSWSALNKAARAAPWRFPNTRFFCLRWEKKDLASRIQDRTKKMLKNGLFDEVQNLLKSGVPESAKPMQSVGYKEALHCYRGDFPYSDLEGKISAETLRLTKRQMTWFRGEEGIEWLDHEFLPHLIDSLMLR